MLWRRAPRSRGIRYQDWKLNVSNTVGLYCQVPLCGETNIQWRDAFSRHSIFLYILITINFRQQIISYYVQSKGEDTQMAEEESPSKKILWCFPEKTRKQASSRTGTYKWNSMDVGYASNWIPLREESLQKLGGLNLCLLLMRYVSKFILYQRCHEFPRDFQAISGLTAIKHYLIISFIYFRLKICILIWNQLKHVDITDGQ
jgi:hypothetical protein